MLLDESANVEAGSSITAPLPARIEGSVITLRWNHTDEQRTGRLCLENYLIPDVNRNVSPLLLKSVVQHWPALDKWSLQWLAIAVRIAPSLRFTHVDPKLMQLYLLLFRPEQAPSMLVPAMSLQELRDRMDERCQLPPLVYSEREYCYMQSPLWPAIMHDVDMTGAPFSCLTCPDDGKAEGLVERQVARMWLSPEGAVSPLHYDNNMSILTQVKGRKRLLLYRPQALKALQPYPNWHILRRRCRVDPAHPDYKRFPAFERVAALEAVLEPGDSLVFPAKKLPGSLSSTLLQQANAAGV
ncbi:g1711 [Coccomyxa viridis]|uniref:G1711 protein n=1 Tax=Coccomyxa viridis TaxID=1274662 RepID=A0ABP1FIM1_9CHLO